MGIPAALRYALAVSRRTPVVCSIRRSGHPSRPNATTCSLFSVLKTLLHADGACFGFPSVSMSRAYLCSLAGFQVTTIGRFWVTAEERQDHLLRSAYALAAAVVGADKHIAQSEIVVAETLGRQLFKDFDPTDFREICHHPEDLPDVLALSEVLGGVLDQQARVAVWDYVRAIAWGDGSRLEGLSVFHPRSAPCSRVWLTNWALRQTSSKTPGKTRE